MSRHERPVVDSDWNMTWESVGVSWEVFSKMVAFCTGRQFDRTILFGEPGRRVDGRGTHRRDDKYDGVLGQFPMGTVFLGLVSGMWRRVAPPTVEQPDWATQSLETVS